MVAEPLHDDAEAGHTGASVIPVIDISGRSGGLPSPEVVEQVAKTCEDVGFMVITGHSVSEELIESMLDVTRRFFRQDEEVKALYRSPTGNLFRGYNTGGRYMGGPADVRAGFQASWFEDREAMIEAGYSLEFAEGFEPNIWPESPSEFKTIWREYFQCLKALGDQLLEIAALGLSLPPDWFVPKFSRQSSYLLANYYPPQHEPPLDGAQRLHAHTDYGAFTMLYQDVAAGGLEVECRDGSWLRVPEVPRAFIVNLGDLMAKWTNDRWVATPHRVRNPDPHEAGLERISLPFFQHPNLDAMIEAIPTCVPDGTTPHHPSVLWRDWGKKRMSEFDNED